MNRRMAAAGLVAAAVIGTAGWFGYEALRDRPGEATVQSVPEDALDAGEVVGDVEIVDAGESQPVDAGSTPMAERVAVLGLLNKRNGVSRDVTLRPGRAVRVGETIVRLRACERTAPWEPDRLTGAFVQFDVREADNRWRRAFSGWLYKERPALNVVQHPVYDVWTKSCTMAFPDKGAETVVLDAGAAAKRSSAPKSPARAPATSSDTPSPPASEPLSNTT